MIGSGIAQVIVVSALMAAGAGAIFVVSRTNDGDSRRTQVAAETESGASETPIPPNDETTTPTPEPAGTSMPSPDARMSIGGTAWLNARPAISATIGAFVDDTLCGSTVALTLPDDHLVRFAMEITSNAEVNGCGVPGTVVRFEVDGVVAGQTLTFVPGGRQQVALIAGPAFATYKGTFTFVAEEAGQWISVVPYVGDTLCGATLFGGYGEGPTYYYEVTVDPVDLNSDCGQPGVDVTLRGLLHGSDGSETLLSEPIATVGWDTTGLIAVTDSPSVVAQ